MARKCSVCTHPDRDAIDRAIIKGTALATISRDYAVSEDSLARHRDNGHIPISLKEDHQEKEVNRARDHYQEIRALLDKALSYMDRAEGNGDLRIAIQALREARATLELLTTLQYHAQEQEKPCIVKILKGVSLDDL